MPEVQITIGGRSFEVACQEGEESFLQAAASLLDAEASVLVDQIGRLPESRLLLMSGLMLADKTAGLEERLRAVQNELENTKSDLAALRDQPAPEPERVEVPVIPQSVFDSMAELAARSEALAEAMEEQVAS
ncbi:cell division protein ZapA [Actibacterium mucosum KCTC 23349]|uniref:Cell division protein ZapA n=1 Tax=Actibacterium mucosum KCTC 23349 TaxID=1454373 RepID=A0A037ZFW4_9RHOB|nr:cell division protein ZapA [Actibacterium mucosum]KAJ54498.1 cell division protein ZapA [Actibacterium mucosum KCTC 23349]